MRKKKNAWSSTAGLWHLAMLLLLILFNPTDVDAQSGVTLMGYSGNLLTPSATILQDGQIFASVNRIPKLYADNYRPYERTGMVAAMGFLPFMEVSMGFIRPDNFQGGLGDRTVSVRFWLLHEKKSIPAVAFGFHDFLAVKELELEPRDAQHFSTSYLVAGKRFSLGQVACVKLNAGYGFNWLPSNDRLLNGFFAAIVLSPLPALHLMLENDGEHTNAGVRFIFFDHVHYVFSAWQLKYMMHQLSFTIQL